MTFADVRYREGVSTSGINPWNRALVTGASSGIGRDMCKILSSQGTDLVIVARREDRLKELAAGLDTEVEIIVADLENLSLIHISEPTRPY